MDDQKESIYNSKDISTDDSLYETINVPVEQPTTSPILVNSEIWSTSVYDLSDSENEIDIDTTKKRTSSIDFLMGSASSQADSDKESVGKIYRHRRPGSLYKVEMDKDSSDNLEALESKYKPSSGFNAYATSSLSIVNSTFSEPSSTPYKEDKSLLELPVLPPYNQEEEESDEENGIEEYDKLDKLLESSVNSNVMKQFIKDTLQSSTESSKLLIEKLEEEAKEQYKNTIVSNEQLLRDWNKEFQEIRDMKESKDKYTKFIELTQDFCYCAKTYGKIIIMEVSLPNKLKTIKPVDIGGAAGGVKYLIQGILFKFSKDSLLQEGLWMYGGYEGPSDEKAMKAALHEFKGVVSLHKLEIKGLHLPLVAIIDFRGFRLIASSWLPISKETLVYGSSDGGLTIHNDNKKLYMKMKKACKRLNLKGHWLLNSGIKFYGAGDIEGHVGYDNKYYVVDLARLFPPQAPLKSERDSRAVFYKLLRPELVRTNTKALSSDAFSGWGSTKKLIYNKHVKLATERLLGTIIPEFVKKLLQSPMHHINADARLIDKMHRHGINTRFIGKLRDLVPISPDTIALRNYLLLEIVSRVIKNIIREKLRTKMRELAPPSATPYKSTILSFLNSIVLANKPDDSEVYWKETIKDLIIDKFDGGLSEEELSHSFDLRNNIDITKLFQLIEYSTQIQFDPQVYANLRKNTPITLSKRDIVKFGIKIRIMNIIDFSEAMILTIEATSKEGAESERLFIMAHKKFQEALSKISDDPIALYNWGKCFTLQGSKKNGIIRTVEERLTLLSSGIKRYRASLSIKSDFHECLYWLAKTNAKIAIFKKSHTESQPLLLDAANKYQRALAAHQDMYEQILDLKANKKYHKSKQTVGILNELYLLYAIYLLEAIIAVKSDANRLYKLALWKLELQIAKTNVIIPSTQEEFKKPFKIFEEALKQDSSLIPFFIEHTRQSFDMAMKASTESAEKFFLSTSLRLTLLEQFGVQHVKEVVDIDQLKSSNYGVFLKIMPNSFIHHEYLNISKLDLSTIPHVTNLALEKLIDCIGNNIQSLKLANCNMFTENTLIRVQECTNLTELSLRNVTNTSTLVLTTISKKLSQLQILDVSHCLLLQPTCIADLQNQLTSLNLSNCTNISDNTIDILCSSMPRLKSLRIDDCIKLRNIRCIRKLTSLEELSLNRNKQIPEELLSQLFQDCNKLFTIRLKECSQVTDTSIITLAHYNKRINCINLWGTNASEKGVSKLVSSKPDWIKVKFPKLSQFSDSILKKFAKSSPNLQKLSLPIAKLGDSTVVKIATVLTKLQSLDLRGCEKLNIHTPGKLLALLTRLEKFNVSGIHFGGALSSSGSSPSLVQSQNNLVLFGVGSAALTADLLISAIQFIKQSGSFIKILDLSKSLVTDDSCQVISTACINLTKLNLSFCDGITDLAVKRISENCSKLEYLFLSKCNNITFYCIHWLSMNLTYRLISLDLSYCSSFVESPPIIKLPSLRTLKLSSCRWITDVVILAITNGCHGLQYLDAENIKVSDVTISFITKRCLELRYLLLSSSNMQISASAIKQLATKCIKLQILDLTGLTLTEAQTQYFTTNFENLHTLILLGDEKGQRAREQLKQTRPSLTVKTRLL